MKNVHSYLPTTINAQRYRKSLITLQTALDFVERPNKKRMQNF